MPKVMRAIVLCLCFGLLIACQAAPPESPTPETIELNATPQVLGQVDATGGKACSQGGVCLVFPAGAVDAALALKAAVAAETGEGTLGRVYELSAATESFAKPVSLQLPVPAGAESDELEVVFWRDGAWVAVPTQVADNGKVRIGTTDHLSRWSLRRKPNSAACKANADCSRGQACVKGVCETATNCTRTSVEICGDGKDNDCDGKIDNGCVACRPTGNCGAGKVCGAGGYCVLAGPTSPTCSSDSDCARGQVCSSRGTCEAGAPCLPTAEICDGKDNDCDGQVDEGLTRACYSGPRGTSGVGPCIGGTQTCSGGAWGVCQGAVLPKPETCNRIDDDCDGQVDDNCSSPGTCRSDADCASGETCGSRGTCIKSATSCSSDADCARGETCGSFGTCESSSSCRSGQTMCSRSCVDLKTDAANCGSCGSACGRGQTCQAGVCGSTSPGSCSSNADCASGQVCSAGSCVATRSCRQDSDCGRCGICLSGGICQ